MAKSLPLKSGTGSVDYAKANIKDLRRFPNIDNAYMELTNRADAFCTIRQFYLTLLCIKTEAAAGWFKAVGESLEAQQYGVAFQAAMNCAKVNGALKTFA